LFVSAARRSWLHIIPWVGVLHISDPENHQLSGNQKKIWLVRSTTWQNQRLCTLHKTTLLKSVAVLPGKPIDSHTLNTRVHRFTVLVGSDRPKYNKVSYSWSNVDHFGQTSATKLYHCS
jgi:hypothetical protein